MLKEILKVFTKEYREKTECFELMRAKISDFKLSTNKEESIEDKIARLSNVGFQSNFHISVGDY